MMTKKDYERAAEIIRQSVPKKGETVEEAIIATFIIFFHEDNPRFDAERFAVASQARNTRKRTG